MHKGHTRGFRLKPYKFNRFGHVFWVFPSTGRVWAKPSSRSGLRFSDEAAPRLQLASLHGRRAGPEAGRRRERLGREIFPNSGAQVPNFGWSTRCFLFGSLEPVRVRHLLRSEGRVERRVESYSFYFLPMVVASKPDIRAARMVLDP